MSNTWFDRTAAAWLVGRSAKIFVGVESCALASLVRAGEMGMTRVLDCPGLPAKVLDLEERRASERFDAGLTVVRRSTAMLERKERELASADVVLCCSQFQREKLTAENPQLTRSEVIPLWTDVGFWRVAATDRRFAEAGRPLRVLCAGAISLRKGVPYLLEAVDSLPSEVSLTLVGAVSPEMTAILKRFRSHRRLPYVSKLELRDLYRQHDVLVVPTLGDSFGFVILEAMASGMPVIASQSAGAPVPDEIWRVPAHDSDAIRDRLLLYHADRALLRHDGDVGLRFSESFPPSAYRSRVRRLFSELLAA